jgi:hypothetical protein
MDFVQGRSVEELLQGTYKDDVMPPILTFHILIKIVRAQQHLRNHRKCHIDLKQGEDVILSADSDSPWLSVTLVDVAGVQNWQDHKTKKHLVVLARNTMGRMQSIPSRWMWMTLRVRKTTSPMPTTSSA